MRRLALSGLPVLQDLAHLALQVWVQEVMSKIWINSQNGLSVLCFGVESTFPYHLPTKQDTNTSNNNGQVEPV